jgi:hypothetical protein
MATAAVVWSLTNNQGMVQRNEKLLYPFTSGPLVKDQTAAFGIGGTTLCQMAAPGARSAHGPPEKSSVIKPRSGGSVRPWPVGGAGGGLEKTAG